jgi:hypothetical protein
MVMMKQHSTLVVAEVVAEPLLALVAEVDKEQVAVVVMVLSQAMGLKVLHLDQVAVVDVALQALELQVVLDEQA